MNPEETRSQIENSDVFETTFTGTHTSVLGIDEQVGIPDRYRVMHVLNTGATGKGKTQMMIHAALQDTYKGRGLCILVPKGDAAEQILAKMPEDRLDDVEYINLSRKEIPSINVLEPHITEDMTRQQKENQKEIIVSDLIDLFKRQTDNWGERWGRILETLLRAHIDLNIHNNESNTLVDVFNCVTGDEALPRLIQRTDDDVVVKQLERVEEDMGTYELEPLQRRLNDFLMNSTIRDFISGRESGLNFREALDNQKIVLVEIQKGEIGGMVAELAGSIIITKVWAAAQSRINQDPEDRTPFYLYVDELQNFGSEGSALATMLSEAREYKLGLWLATQYLSNLDSKQMRDAVINNCRSKIVFDPSGSDNESRLAGMLTGVSKEDLSRMIEYRAALQTPSEGDQPSEAVVFDTYPPYEGDSDRVRDWKNEAAVAGSTNTEEQLNVNRSLGSGANAGGEIHKKMLLAAQEQLEQLPDTSVTLMHQNTGADKPDGKVVLPEEQGGVAHLEAEKAGLSKPANVLNNYLRATEEGVECIFVVPEGKAAKLQNIVSDPVNRQGSDHEDEDGRFSYYATEDGEFTDVEVLEEEGEFRVVEVDTEELEAEIHEETVDAKCPLLDAYSEEELKDVCIERDQDSGFCSALGQQCVLTQGDD